MDEINLLLLISIQMMQLNEQNGNYLSEKFCMILFHSIQLMKNEEEEV